MSQRHRNNSTPSTIRKRTHLKPSQVAVLQESFVSNPLPDSYIRNQLALQLGVTERTIQIWFQNRRAKARKLESLGNGGIPALMPNVRTGWIESPLAKHPASSVPRFQATFRSMMTPERFEELQEQQSQHHQLPKSQHSDTTSLPDTRRRPRSSSKPEPRLENSHHHHRQPIRALSEGADHVSRFVSFSVSTVRIGAWARFASTQQDAHDLWDLMCYADVNQRQLVWQVLDGGHQFRITTDISAITQLRLGQVPAADAEGGMVGQLEIDIDQSVLPVTFAMFRSGVDQDWTPCGDFSEQKQASLQSTHVLLGSHECLGQAVLDLVACFPELVPKFTSAAVIPPELVGDDDACRDTTLSPATTPEPVMPFPPPLEFTKAMPAHQEWMQPSPQPQETPYYCFSTMPHEDMAMDQHAWSWNYYYGQMATPASIVTSPPSAMFQ